MHQFTHIPSKYVMKLLPTTSVAICKISNFLFQAKLVTQTSFSVYDFVLVTFIYNSLLPSSVYKQKHQELFWHTIINFPSL